MKKIPPFSLILLAFIFLASSALAWGPATHAYINDQLMKKKGMKNLNEMYGGMSCDLFNSLFESPHRKDFSMQTHYQFLKIWDQARTGSAKSLAYGFISHNDLWGADSTANHAGRTSALTEGYIIGKANELSNMAPLPSDLLISSEGTLELYREIIEAGVDLLVKRQDPVIGEKITTAAMRRSREFPYLLVRAYSSDLTPYFGNQGNAAKAIVAAESEFRKSMIVYGLALMQDEWVSLQLISENMTDHLEKSFAASNVPAPPREQIDQLIAHYITIAISLCEADYAKEISETQNQVAQQMSLTGISY